MDDYLSFKAVLPVNRKGFLPIGEGMASMHISELGYLGNDR